VTSETFEDPTREEEIARHLHLIKNLYKLVKERGDSYVVLHVREIETLFRLAGIDPVKQVG